MTAPPRPTFLVGFAVGASEVANIGMGGGAGGGYGGARQGGWIGIR